MVFNHQFPPIDSGSTIFVITPEYEFHINYNGDGSYDVPQFGIFKAHVGGKIMVLRGGAKLRLEKRGHYFQLPNMKEVEDLGSVRVWKPSGASVRLSYSNESEKFTIRTKFGTLSIPKYQLREENRWYICCSNKSRPIKRAK